MVCSSHRLQSDGGISEVGSADLRSSRKTFAAAGGDRRGTGSHGNEGSTRCSSHLSASFCLGLYHSHLVWVQRISRPGQEFSARQAQSRASGPCWLPSGMPFTW